MVIVPLVGELTPIATRVSPSASVSLSSSDVPPPEVIVTVPASSRIRVSLPTIVTGGSLIGLIVMVTVAALPLLVPSLAA